MMDLFRSYRLFMKIAL